MTEINDAEKRPFKGIWVPVDVWQDQRLTKCELCLLMEINSLDGKDGCYATNQYFADFLNTTQRSVSRSLSKLIELEYVKIEKPDGSKRVLRSCLAKKEKNDPKGVDKNVVGGRQNCLGGVTKLSPRIIIIYIIII